jgi:imidazolonepropionase-like amidohydrolase
MAGATTFFEGARLIVGDARRAHRELSVHRPGRLDHVGRQARLSVSRRPARPASTSTGKTVMPALIDGHNHIGLVNERDGTNKKENYTRENLVDQLERVRVVTAPRRR